MSSAYIDTGLLVKLYTAEINSPQAVAIVSQFPAPLPLTAWQELELRTALRCRAFRGEITGIMLRAAMRALDSDILTGRWERPACDPYDVHREAERLSEKYAVILGCRTLDVLHVAAALVINAKPFVTFDARQGALAARAGLSVTP